MARSILQFRYLGHASRPVPCRPEAVERSGKNFGYPGKLANSRLGQVDQHRHQSRIKNISIRGARQHNLKNVDVDIPRDKLTVMTGLSGSGKSSLAFDTIYAEGQRRYVRVLSAYARQFLELMQKPDVDHIEGLSPAISIEQKTTSQKSALHRRHRDRDLRLSAPVVRARRRALFARHRPADRKPDRQPDGRPNTGPARRHAALSLRARSCAAARANTARNSPICRRRVSSASRWTANITTSRARPCSTRRSSTTSKWWWTVSR